ncbi:MAG: LamB/YcsF family protein, partial [Gemmatimonadaceae bacterium]|nr:LamB/YcsF family protein [Gemmatimonadaceae bacterium]
MPTVDLNSDCGESFGAWTHGADEEVLSHVTSANIACGFHAGDPGVMRRTVRLALQHGLALGAHPGFPDLAGFGRRNIEMSPQDAYDLVVYQIGALAGIAATQGATLHHVKPHGALYNLAATREPLAAAIARAVRDVEPRLVLYALAGSALVTAARDAGLAVAEEVFADRRYAPQGTLLPRSEQGAVIESSAEAVRQAVRMVRDGVVTAIDGSEVKVRADTICIHGDTPGAAEHARQLRAALAG